MIQTHFRHQLNDLCAFVTLSGFLSQKVTPNPLALISMRINIETDTALIFQEEDNFSENKETGKKKTLFM